MRYKVSTLFAAIIGLLFICVYAHAAVSFDPDVGNSTVIVKAKASDDDQGFQCSVMAFEPAPAWIRHKFVSDTYKQSKAKKVMSFWNCRINHNYPFQIPGKAGPPLIRHVLLE